MPSFDERADGDEVGVRVGEDVEIVLPENRMTGYRWTLEASGEPVCVVSGDELRRSGGGPGSGGSRVWRFRAVQAGTATIELSYARPWEGSAQAVRRFSLRVRASESASPPPAPS